MRGGVDRSLAELERVYRAKFKTFMQTATAYLGDADLARDAVQEGVANAIRNSCSYRGEGTLEAWLWKVVLNAIRSHHRDKAHGLMLVDRSDEKYQMAQAPELEGGSAADARSTSSS